MVRPPHDTQPCREAVHKLLAWLYVCRRSAISSNTSAYCQARRKQLSETFLQDTHHQLVAQIESQASATFRWHGHRVGVVDGSTVSMPDTTLNQARYPQPSEQKIGCGLPVMKRVGIFSLATGRWHVLAYGKLVGVEARLLVTPSLAIRSMAEVRNFQRKKHPAKT